MIVKPESKERLQTIKLNKVRQMFTELNHPV